jgi:hypothetical protein
MLSAAISVSLGTTAGPNPSAYISAAVGGGGGGISELYRIHNHQSVSQSVNYFTAPPRAHPSTGSAAPVRPQVPVSQSVVDPSGGVVYYFSCLQGPNPCYTCLGIEWLFHGPARAHPSAGSPFTTSGPPSTGQSARGPLSHGHGRRHGRHNQELHPAGYNTSDQAAQARIGRGGDEPDYQDVDRTHLKTKRKIRIPRDRPLHTESPWITGTGYRDGN